MLLRSTLIYGPAILFTRICALLFVVVATRIVDQVEYGLLTLVVTVGEMIDVAVTEWMRISLLRLGGKGDITRGSVMRAGGILICTTILALVLAIPASAMVVPDRWPEFLLALSGYLVSGAVARSALVVLQMQQRHLAYVGLEFLRAVLQLALPLATIITDHNSFLAVSLASSAGSLLVGAITSVVAAGRLTEGSSRFTRGEFFALGFPIVAVALVSFGLNSAERVILNAYHGAAPVAVFAAIYALARQPINMIANAVNTGSFPEAVARFDDEGAKAASRFFTQVMALLISLSLPAAALLVALSRDLVLFFLPPEYSGTHGPLFAMIVFAVICTNVTDFVYGAMIHAHKRPQLLIVNKLFGSVFSIGLSLVLIPHLAELGAAYALAGGALISLLVSFVISQRMTPIEIPWRTLGLALMVAVCTGATAYWVAQSLQSIAVFWRLACASSLAGCVFLGLNALIHPRVTMEKLGALKARLPMGRQPV